MHRTTQKYIEQHKNIQNNTKNVQNNTKIHRTTQKYIEQHTKCIEQHKNTQNNTKIHRTIQKYVEQHKKYIEQHKNTYNNTKIYRKTQKMHRTTQELGRVWTVPRICGFYPGICLTTEEKARKNLSQSTVYIFKSTVYSFYVLTQKRKIQTFYTI